jgi:hypothetical protein
MSASMLKRPYGAGILNNRERITIALPSSLIKLSNGSDMYLFCRFLEGIF